MVLSTFSEVVWGAFVVFFLIVPILLIWVFALSDLFFRKDMRWGKVVWLLVIVFFPLGGSVIYLLVRPQGRADTDPVFFTGYPEAGGPTGSNPPNVS